MATFEYKYSKSTNLFVYLSNYEIKRVQLLPSNPPKLCFARDKIITNFLLNPPTLRICFILVIIFEPFFVKVQQF